MISNKVNGHVAAGESLTSALDYFTVATPVILTDVANTVTGVTKLDKLVEIVAQRGQPVILGAVSVGNAGVQPATSTLKFATEHKGSWNVTGNAVVDTSAADLKAALIKDGVDFGFDANTTVTVSASL